MAAGAAGPLAAIEASPLAAAMRHELWLYPIVEIVHISGFVILVGSVAALDLRLLGLSRAIPVTRLARHTLPWAFGALALIVPSGLLMFIAHAADFVSNPAFAAKMTLLLCAGANAGLFHARVYRGVRAWDRDAPPPLAARAHAAASLALWFGVIACGRLLAYL
jgi:hypothetical protein